MGLCQLIAGRPQGLRSGDVLTLDWVPGSGTVVALNRVPLAEPMQGISLYHALLGIWIGERAANPALKARLLGREHEEGA